MPPPLSTRPTIANIVREPTEAEILSKIMLALGRDPRCVIFRNNTGALPDAHGRMVKFGLPGSADLLGILRPFGRFLAIEVKARRGNQSEQQKAFQSMVIKCGGVYILARSVEDALDGMQKATVLQDGWGVNGNMT